MLDPASGGFVELKRTLRRKCEIGLRLRGLINGRDIDSSLKLRMKSMRIEGRSCGEKARVQTEQTSLSAITDMRNRSSTFFPLRQPFLDRGCCDVSSTSADALRPCTSATMSSSSFIPDDESNSDSDWPRTRTSRSFSQTGTPASRPVTPHGFDEEVGNDDTDYDADDVFAEAPDGPKTRHEWVDAQLENIDPMSLHAYAGIIASIEQDINFETKTENEEFVVTQNGAVVWTVTEKEVFFAHLCRKGKNGIKEIAAAIGTKSELEVMDYLNLLHRGVENQHLLERKMQTIIMGDIPGATEISKQCCGELDKIADVLAVKEDIDTSKACREQYGNYGTISEVQAKELVDSEAQKPLRGNIHLAGNLLNVPNWVQLSRRFFMNFGGKKEPDNWRNFVRSEKTESPSISGDALMDFYALTASITRRLMQSAIFFAMARLRSSQLIGRERSQNVRRRDVKAAIDVLNMKSRPPDFLLQCARRNGLLIADITNQKGWVPRVYSYNEAAEILHGEDDGLDQASGNEPSTESDGEHEIGDTSPDPVGGAVEPSHPPSDSESAIDREEEFADILDREASRCEELKLWAVLGQPAPHHLHIPIISEEDAKAGLHKPARERKSKRELVNWRDRTLYRSEWEEYESDLEDVEIELAQNRRKRRRVEDEHPELEYESVEVPKHLNEMDNEPNMELKKGPKPKSKKRPAVRSASTKTRKRPVFRSAAVVNSDDSASDDAADDQELDSKDVGMDQLMDVDEKLAPTSVS